jgi:hypothetical protein
MNRYFWVAFLQTGEGSLLGPAIFGLNRELERIWKFEGPIHVPKNNKNDACAAHVACLPELPLMSRQLDPQLLFQRP